MAKFNPDIPDVVPSPRYSLHETQPITQFEGDKTAGVALTGIADVFKNAVTGADEVVKDMINRGLRSDLTSERDAQTGALEGMVGVPLNQRVSPYVADATGQTTAPQPSGDIIPGATAPVPAGLQTLDGAVRSANTGSLTKPGMETYYSGKLDVIAKNYRDRFRGYEDYVDERVAAITGMNPANERVKDMMSMLQATAAANKTEQHKAMDYVIARNGLEGAQQQFQYLQNGGNPLKAYQWGAAQDGIKANLERRAALRADNKGTDEELKLQTGKDLSYSVSQSFPTMWSGVVQTAFGDATPQQMSNMTVKVLSGETKIQDIEGQQLLQAMAGARKTAFDRKMAEASTPGPIDVKTGKPSPSMLAILGPAETESRINAGLSSYDTTISLLKDKDYGGAFIHANKVKASMADGVIAMQGDPNETVRKFANTYPVVNHMIGPQGTAVLLQGAFGQNLGSDLMDVVNTKKFEVIAGQKTLKQSLDELKAGKIGVKTNDKSLATTVGERGSFETLLNDVPAKIMNPNMPDAGKVSLIKQVYGVGNEGIIDGISPDSYDAKTGRLIPGQNVTFSNMLHPKIIDEAYRLGGDSKTAINRFANTEFSSLFRSDVGLVNTAASNINYKVTYKNINGTPTWAVDPSDAKQNVGVANSNLGLVRQRIDLLNRGLAPMAYLAKKNGTDVDSFVLGQMVSLGLDPNGTGMPSQMLNALIASHPTAIKPAGPAQKSEVIPTAPANQISLDKTSPKVALEDITKKSAEGLDPKFRTGLESAINDYTQETGNSVKIDSLVRSRAEQAQAYARFLGGKGGLAAPPGHSQHEVGRAADFNNDPKFLAWMHKQDPGTYGLEFLPGNSGKIDPGHIQLKRTRTAEQ